ncbi:hypothetical protein BpHYR1_008867 [Brachionus plicatilis]|uniref:Uncharacterized protein n=1 Tax=Brachionus plicatilis TaxID=10195 RepID=A0A3M7Q1C7_BRAPC|nr:hypothetical protein BpHYR1_008867 [Brachionus plicatilis]
MYNHFTAKIQLYSRKSNDVQRNKQLVGRYVLSELALNTEINNNQNIRNLNKSTAPASASNSIVNGLVIAK